MFAFLFKKQKQLEALIHEYMAEAKVAQDNFSQATERFLSNGRCSPDFDFLVEETHKAESRSDDIKERIEKLLFEKTLIPEFQGDILELLEYVDEIPDQFDRILYAIQRQRICLPSAMINDVKDLVAVSLEACDLMQECMKCLLHGAVSLPTLLKAVDQREGHGDHIEHRVILHIFESDMDPFQKILLRDLTMAIGDIADHVKRASRLVRIITIKRRV